MYKAVLFDLDDTLLDWSGFQDGWDRLEAVHLAHVFEYLSGLHPLANVDVYREEYVRRTRDAWIEARHTLRSPHLGRLLVDTAVAVGFPVNQVDLQGCLNAYRWRAVRGTRVFPEVPAVLQGLIDRGIKLGIVTNSFHPMSLRDLELREHGLLDFFPDCRVTAADAGFLKPHPEIFDLALTKLGVTADEAVFVGDNPVADIAGAQGAGIAGILRRKGERLPATGGLVIPDASLHNLRELPAIMEKLYVTRAAASAASSTLPE